MEEFFFGAGIALLISLVAWSDQIRSLHKETLEAESLLYTNRNINWRRIKQLIRKKVDPQTILDELNRMLKKESSENIDNIELILKLRSIDKKLRYLENLHNLKYNFILFLTAAFLIAGVVYPQINSCSTFSLLKMQIHFQVLPFTFCITFCGLLLIFLVYLNIVEKNFRIEFDTVMEEI